MLKGRNIPFLSCSLSFTSCLYRANILHAFILPSFSLCVLAETLWPAAYISTSLPAGQLLLSYQFYSVQQVLRPCSVALETKTKPNQPLSGSVTVEQVIIKVH